MSKLQLLFVIALLVILSLSIFLITFFMNNTTNNTDLTWNVQTVDWLGNLNDDSSIALDSKGNPQISYAGLPNGSRGSIVLKYAVWNRSNWNIQTVESLGNNGFYSSIAIDSHDYPHISYCDNTYYNGNEYHLKYANWNGSAWNIQTVDSNVGLGSSIALDSEGNPHIVYSVNNGGLKYANWTGSTWIIQTVDSKGAIYGDRSIALDSDSHPCIIYSNDGLKYAKWDGSKWTIQTVVPSGFYFSSIALDSNNHPHVSYSLMSDGYLCYASWNGKTWSTQTVDSNAKGANGNSIALGSDGIPHICCSYSLSYSPNYVKYAEQKGSSWNVQTVNTTGPVWTYTSLALDANNNPHICCFRNLNGSIYEGALTYVTGTTS